MTGLDIEKDQIIEMACLITDSDLNILAEVGWSLESMCTGVPLITSAWYCYFVIREGLSVY